MALYSLGFIFRKMREFDQAKRYLNRSVDILKEAQNPFWLFPAGQIDSTDTQITAELLTTTNEYAQTAELDSAEAYYQRALTFSQDNLTSGKQLFVLGRLSFFIMKSHSATQKPS